VKCQQPNFYLETSLIFVNTLSIFKKVLRFLQIFFQFSKSLAYIYKTLVVSHFVNFVQKILILSLTLKLYRSQNDAVLVLKSRVKLTFCYDFLYERDKVRKNQILIHLDEKF
jgi:hypothetical protein